MTPQLAARLTVHEGEGLGATVVAPRLVPLVEPSVLPLAPGREAPAFDDQRLASLWRRDALHRRLLGLADVAGAAVTLLVVLDLVGHARTGFAALALTPLVVLVFKLAGLYDRDELR